MNNHILLLGDSILDNGNYVGKDLDVVSHLQNILPGGWKVTLRAVDGSTTTKLRTQLIGIPSDTSHMVISIGGNDALGSIDMLSLPANSTSEALEVFYTQINRFESDYSEAIREVRRYGLPSTVCTIYDGNFSEPQMRRATRTALMMFNDVILRQAIENRMQVIDLRMVCTEKEDYANEIEPSGQGGYKIARAIAHAVSALDSSTKRNEIWGV